MPYKIADRFVLEGGKVRYIVDNVIQDVLLEDTRDRKGTRVVFPLKQRSRKDLKKLFDEYAGSDCEFDKTRIAVYLSGARGENIARSQAKRMLFGLEKFRQIVLDFKKVRGIGQGFSDEVFRVFRAQHPSIRIESVNMSPSVAFMIQRTTGREGKSR